MIVLNVKSSHLWMASLAIIKSKLLWKDQHKTAFIFPWGTFAYRKLPFGLKNVGATFQWAMYYAFHDIKHIIQPYLDDLPAGLPSDLIT
jgi:hypothetical protein